MPRYRVIARAGCTGGTCPAVYDALHLGADVLVQGYVVPSEAAAELGVPVGETLVRVPRSMLVDVREQDPDVQ